MDPKTCPAACAEGGEDGFGGVVETILASRVVPAFGEEAEIYLMLDTFLELDKRKRGWLSYLSGSGKLFGSRWRL